jgi:hypothetical protein
MRLKLFLGAAIVAATAATGYAQSHSPHHVVVRHDGRGLRADADADGDGWITRAEAGALAERVFADMDSNHDGRLTPDDRGEGHRFEMRLGQGEGENCDQTVEAEGRERRVVVICRNEQDGERRTERRITILRSGEQVGDEEMRRIEEEIERTAEGAERDAERAEREAERVERHVERHAWVMRSDGGGAHAPTPPMPPHPPMFMLLFANSQEADLDGDGALSLEEFRAQHLRFFDASDVNGDGRVRVMHPPEPPAPPAPPEPPHPQRRR